MLRDRHGRTFDYLRLSVTDVCNFACAYCLPHGYAKPAHKPADLSREEIARLVRGFAELGFWKVRLSGGEPSTRADLVEIVRDVAATPGISRVALSTNGYKLSDLARPLREAGLHAVNVSVDSLDRSAFHAITGRDALEEVLAGVEAALAAGLQVKVNAVLHDGDHSAFFSWAERAPVVVRFIELMQTEDNVVYFRRHHSRADGLRGRLLADGWQRRARAVGDGPAEEFVKAGARGGVGIIAAYSDGFCETCNRLRVSSAGRLRLCLFGDGDFDLRPHLQRDADLPALLATVRACLDGKAAAHRLHEGDPGSLPHLAAIGG